MARSRRYISVAAVLFTGLAFYLWGHFDGREGRSTLIDETFAAEGSSAVSPVLPRELDVYYPNTEALAPDEMRVIACGTGMPTARPKQAASCWLLELGNGDKFLFDIGTGSAERIAAMQIPYNYLDKVFLSHLHTDHFGDLVARDHQIVQVLAAHSAVH